MRYSNTIIVTLGLFLGTLTSASAENFYKWTDSRGVVHYGEEPPKNQRANKVEMPAITVLEDYGKQWLPRKDSSKKNKKSQISSNVPVQKVATPTYAPSYNSLKFIAPRPGQIINAKDGDVSAMMSIKPPLKKGHNLIFSVDGKSNPKTRSRITNFKNLSAGTHTATVLIVDNKGKVQMNSEELSFEVKR